MEQPKWEWVDTLIGILGGTFSAIGFTTSWINRRLREMDGRVNEVHGRVTPLAVEVAALKAHHEAKMQRLLNIETRLGSIDDKQDKQMALLVELAADGRKRGDE